MNALKNKGDDEPTNTGTGWLVAKEESESYIMTNYHVISAIMQRRRQTQREIKVHILIRATLYPVCIYNCFIRFSSA
jgi:S1-C subfamily serine protease